MEAHESSKKNQGQAQAVEVPALAGHQMSPTDPDSPMGWSLGKRIYTSFVAWSFTFVILYGTTTLTAALPVIPEAYNISVHTAHLAYTLPFFGVFLAPIYTPHLSEYYGRRPIYLTSFPLFLFCVVLIGVAENASTLLAFRFLAGLAGGPCVVLIEGTFADVWPASKTLTYYSFLTLASYLGAAFGPLIGGYVLTAQGPAWLSWVTLIFGAIALGFGGFMPETYGREILRQRNGYLHNGKTLPAAQSGTTLGAMAHITVLSPLKMLIAEPIVIMSSLYLGLNFALVFQWFVSVPAVLGLVYDFDVHQAGLAFIAAIGGVFLAAVTCSTIESLTTRGGGMPKLETRLIPAAFVGGPLVFGSLFWIGATAAPDFSYYSPIFGTAFFVWGNATILISFISYLFDAYPPAGTLSALTAAACFRLLCAGIVPIFILDSITSSLGGLWTYGTFGFLALFMNLFPIIMFFTGAKLRRRSHYGQNGVSVVETEMMAKNESMRNSTSEA